MKHILICLVTVLCLALLVGCSGNPGTPGDTTPGTTAEQTPSTPAEVAYKYSLTDGKATIVSYVGKGGDITIPETLDGYPVEAIGSMAFAYNDNVTSVAIPGSFADTGYMAFYGCEKLTSVTIGEGVTSVGMGSFAECTALTSVSLPDSIVTLEASAFKGCSALASIDLKNVQYLRDAAFCATGLTSISVPASVVEGGENTFAECESLTKVTWLSTAFLDQMTFAFCYNLAEVDLSGNPSRIYDSCFRRCYALTEIVIPTSVDRIYSDAFMGCTGLKTVTIENPTISRIYSMSFHWLPALTDVYFAGSEAQWNNIDIGSDNEGLELATVHFGA